MRKQTRLSKLTLSTTKIRELNTMGPTDLQRVGGGFIGPCAKSVIGVTGTSHTTWG
jgi:hypothetical protein